MEARTLKIMSVILIAIVGVSGFFAGSYMASKQIVEVEKKPPKTIKIGCVFPLTGTWAPYHEKNDEITIAWAEVINKRGGIYLKDYNASCPVELIIYDCKSDAPTAVSFYEKLVTVDKVDVLIGIPASAIFYSASTIAEKYKMPIIAGPANDIKIYERGFEWIFCTQTPGYMTPWPYIDRLKYERDVLGTPINKLALLYQDRLWTVDIFNGIRTRAKSYNFEIVYDEKIPTEGLMDYTTVLLKIKAENPDVIFVDQPKAALFYKQAKELDVNPMYWWDQAGTTPGFKEPLGEMSYYVDCFMFYMPEMRFGNWELAHEVIARSGVDPMKWPWPYQQYIALEAMYMAIEKSGTLEPTKLRDTIKQMHVMTIAGPLWFEKNGMGTLMPAAVQSYPDGTTKVIWPLEAATGDHLKVPPWDQR